MNEHLHPKAIESILKREHDLLVWDSEVSVCKEWVVFESFFEDLKDTLPSLERNKLLRQRRNEPLSPSNYYWSDRRYEPDEKIAA